MHGNTGPKVVNTRLALITTFLASCKGSTNDRYSSFSQTALGCRQLYLLLWSCATGKKASNGHPESLHFSVSVGKSAVKLGQEVNVSVEGVPEGWAGEPTINLRHFSFHSLRYTLRATLQNGFKTKGQSDSLSYYWTTTDMRYRSRISATFP